MAKLNTRHNSETLDCIVQCIRQARAEVPGGNIGLMSGKAAFDFHDLAALVLPNVGFHPDVPELLRHGLVRSAILDVAQDSNADVSGLIKAVDDRESQFLRLPRQPFIVASALSLRPVGFTLARIASPNLKVDVHRSRPASIMFGKLENTLRQHGLLGVPADWSFVIMFAQGRTAEDAAAGAFQAFNTARAIWNFAINFRMGIRISSPVDVPANDIRLGPVQTIHNPDGTIASEAFWYQQPFVAVSCLS